MWDSRQGKPLSIIKENRFQRQFKAKVLFVGICCRVHSEMQSNALDKKKKRRPPDPAVRLVMVEYYCKTQLCVYCTLRQ